MLLARVTAPSFRTDDARFLVRCEIQNPDPVDYLLLKWFTPLEGLLSDCLRVERRGERVPYDGRLLKRGTPGANDYILIPAGQTVHADVDLGEAYQVSTAGEYSVAVDPPLLDYFELRRGLVSPNSNLGRRGDKTLESTPGAFAVTGAEGREKGPARLTAGEAVRQAEQRRETTNRLSGRASKAGAALEPQFSGGDATRQAQTRQAHFDGYELCVAALNSLANDAWYKEWFGTHTATRFQTVKNTFTTIQEAMETKTFTYDLTGDGCSPGTYAYTYMGRPPSGCATCSGRRRPREPTRRRGRSSTSTRTRRRRSTTSPTARATAGPSRSAIRTRRSTTLTTTSTSRRAELRAACHPAVTRATALLAESSDHSPSRSGYEIIEE